MPRNCSGFSSGRYFGKLAAVAPLTAAFCSASLNGAAYDQAPEDSDLLKRFAAALREKLSTTALLDRPDEIGGGSLEQICEHVLDMATERVA